jgi:short-subunit dehydrogenase
MQYAIITGATQGIGKAIAERLLKEGFSIAICARNKEELYHIQQEWKQQYPTANIIAIPTDMGNKEAVSAFADTILKEFPTIDILVNNAGTFLPGALADEPDGHLETLMAVNLYSAYYMTRAILPYMKQQKKGHIFNMCSVASLQPYTNGGSYAITKYALSGFSENLREELKPYNIRVTALYPGATYSRSWEGSGVDAKRMIACDDIANILYASYVLSAQADVETIVIRPLQGDL